VARFTGATTLGTGLVYDNGADVGINTPSPPYTLTVAPGGLGSGLGVSWNQAGGGGETDFYNYGQGGPGGFYFYNYYAPGSNYPTTGATRVFTIQSNGYVGIGSSGPGYLLDVAGQARFTGGYTTSDRRLKTHIVDIGYGLGDVMKLRPVFFDWKKPAKGEEGRRVGFIAQEVEQIIPEIVSTAPDEMKTKAVEYGNITPVLVKAIQELHSLFDVDHGVLGKLQALFDSDHDDIAKLKAANDNQAKAIDDLRAANDNETAQIKSLTARLNALEAKLH
jgi:hypothetical protein